MLVHDPLGARSLAHEQGRRLRNEAATRRDGTPSPRSRALAASLRRAADRLDPTPLARTPATQP